MADIFWPRFVGSIGVSIKTGGGAVHLADISTTYRVRQTKLSVPCDAAVRLGLEIIKASGDPLMAALADAWEKGREVT